jgi:2-keto-4-pentenoate hydratase/2-oxohepta-3-ene-1,7-dioic acid hydratase in catechol pathway
MRILRCTPPEHLGVGKDPHFGILGENNQIQLLKGDPLYSGIVPLDKTVSLEEVRLLAPVIPRSKVVCMGKNYADHAAEMNSSLPSQPLIFLKPNTSVVGPGDTIAWPAMSERVDFEGELAIVISRICKDVPRERVNDVIFGYTIANDVTARDLQSVDKQWTRAKGFDTFCPLGPWIETEFTPGNQRLITSLNNEVKQSEPISSMIFGIPEIIHFISSVMTLLPGDVLLTGTPAGIGPMNPGDTVSVSIEGIGTLTNTVSQKNATGVVHSG